MNQNSTVMGKGTIKIALFGSGAYFDLGNCEGAKLTPKTSRKELANNIDASGGNLDTIDIVDGVDLSVSGLSQFNRDVLNLLTKGRTTSLATPVSVTEQVKGTRGAFAVVSKILDTTKTVTVKKGAATIPIGDYTLTNSGVRLAAGATSFTDGDVLDITYTPLAQQTTEALLDPNLEYALLFDGVNMADNGKPMQVRAHRVRFAAGAIDLINNDFAKSDIDAAVLRDASKGAGQSAFFYVSHVI